jgi:DNA-binding NarL/FixJ family response regulator
VPATDRIADKPRRGGPQGQSVLITVEPPSLQRLIGHILHGQNGLWVVGTAARNASPASLAARLAPDVIVTNQRLQRLGKGDVSELKRSSPSSRLILLTHNVVDSAQLCADVCLPEAAIVSRLLPMIRKAALRAADRTNTPAVAGPRT